MSDFRIRLYRIETHKRIYLESIIMVTVHILISEFGIIFYLH